jgi:CO/xanthine dehydrogenase Mo-binding subunit
VYIWSNTAGANYQASISNYFMIPTANITERVGLGGTSGGSLGGGFGNNDSLYEEAVLAVALSKKAGMSPVKLVMTKSGNSLATRTRWPYRAYITAAAKNGLITAVKAVLYINSGAVAGPGSIGFCADYFENYNVPNLDISYYSVNTNAIAQPAYQRDVGITQNDFFMESAVDALAEKLNIDPATFRLNNLRTAAYTDPTTGRVYPDTAFNITTGLPYSGYGHPATFLKTTAAFNWSGRWKGWSVPSGTPTNSGETQGTGQKLRGVGISVNNGDPSRILGFPSVANISVSPKGVITALPGGADQGSGLCTTLPIIVGELLGQTSLSGMVVTVGDTSLGPVDAIGSVASRSTGSMGMASVMAARNLASQWFPIVAAHLAPGTQASNLAFGNNAIYDTTNPTNSMSFNAAAALLPSTITGIGTFWTPPKVAFALARTSCCEVEVDVETADVRVISYVGGIGTGRTIFVKGTEAQLQGSMAGMGLALALYQEHINDSSTGLKYSGSYLSPNLLDQKIPTIMNAPDTITGVYEEYVDPIGPFGAIGFGQEVMSGVPAMIVSALSNALGGYRFTKLPVRKEDIVTALQWMEANGKLPS